MRFRLLPVAAVVAVLVAACGGSSTPTTTKTTTPHKSAVTRTNTSAAANMTTNTSAATTAISQTVSTSSTPTFASATNCLQLAGVGEQFAKAMSSATSGGKFDLNKVVAAYQGLANAAPSAIRPDIRVLTGALSAYATDLAKAGYTFGTVPSASQITAIESAVKVLESANLKAAVKRLQAWAVQNCR